MKTFRSKTLTCGCCGCWFDTWPEYVDQDQDEGFGICQPCQDDIAERHKSEMDNAIDLIAGALGKERRKKFLASSRATQETFVMRCLDKKILTFKITTR